MRRRQSPVSADCISDLIGSIEAGGGFVGFHLWSTMDEWYLFKNVAKDKLHVLALMQTGDTTEAAAGRGDARDEGQRARASEGDRSESRTGS